MPDTYLTVSTVAADQNMRNRVAAAYAAEQGGPASAGAEQWAYSTAYWWASAPGWAAAVDSWLVANPDGGNGWSTDPGVISDGMILAQVQSMLGAGD